MTDFGKRNQARTDLQPHMVEVRGICTTSALYSDLYRSGNLQLERSVHSASVLVDAAKSSER